MNGDLTSSWVLINIEKSYRENSEALRIPSRQERENQAVNDLVQLHFVPAGQDGPVEPLWVEIMDVEEGRYEGELVSEPQTLTGLDVGTMIRFGPEHIGRVLVRPGNPLWCDCYEKRVIISARILEPGKGACHAYREEPAHEEDSGWRLTEGSEDEAYMEDFSNARLILASELIDLDQSLAAVFRGEFGDSCHRPGRKELWIADE